MILLLFIRAFAIGVCLAYWIKWFGTIVYLKKKPGKPVMQVLMTILVLELFQI